MSDPPVKYVAELPHVREVSLLGTADLSFWTERLREEGLFPTAREGKAELLLGASDSRYLGVPFRELTLAVSVSQTEGGDARDGVFLAHAFNSSRLFAFVERRCFSTPYHHGRIRVEAGLPASMRVEKAGAVLFRAEMAAGPREPDRVGEEWWQGPVLLPSRFPGKGERLFYARLGGLTRAFRFGPSDVFEVSPPTDCPALGLLLASGFRGREWRVRPDARHARAKTVRRVEAGW